MWEAVDMQLDRLVAVKLIRTSNRSAFEREARMTARLEHEHAVRLYDFGIDANNNNYLVLELVRGKSADHYIETFQMMPAEQRLLHVSLMCLHVSHALTEAHHLKIVHRDVKPPNILMVEGAMPLRAKLGDFGIAAMVGEEGTLRRTFHFASPEQLAGQPLDTSSDVYSLGATMYTALMGQPPYGKDNLPSQLIAIKEKRRPPLTDDLRLRGAKIDEIIDAMLCETPNDRPSIQVVAAILRRQLASDPSTVDAALAALPPAPPSLSTAFGTPGISGIYESRERFASDYPIDSLLAAAVGGELLIVGRTLRNFFNWSGAIEDGLENGMTLRLCLLRPEVADSGSFVARQEIDASIAVFRKTVDPYVRRRAPRATVRLSFHSLPGLDSFIRLRSSRAVFSAWQLAASRNRAERRTFVIDSESGFGRDLINHYDAICRDAETRALAYSYENGVLVDKLAN